MPAPSPADGSPLNRPGKIGRERRKRPESLLAGLDLLASGVVVLDAEGRAVFINQSAEQLFELSSRTLQGHPFARMFANGMVIDALVEEACNNAFGQKHGQGACGIYRQEFLAARPRIFLEKLQLFAELAENKTYKPA